MYCKFKTPCGLCSLKSIEGLAQVKCTTQETKHDEPTPEQILGLDEKWNPLPEPYTKEEQS